jgi:hypothetical protein
VQVTVITHEAPSFDSRYFVPICTRSMSLFIGPEADRVGVLAVMPGPGGAEASRWYLCEL